MQKTEALHFLFVLASVGQLCDWRELFARLPGEKKHPPMGRRDSAHLVTPGSKSTVDDCGPDVRGVAVNDVVPLSCL